TRFSELTATRFSELTATRRPPPSLQWGKPPTTHRPLRAFMAGYQLEGPKPARMYEVILPKKLGYFGKVQEVLEDLFDERAIRAIPFVKNSIAKKKKDPHFDEEAWIKTLCQASRGYSIYEMDGRYLSPSGPIDERVL